MSLDIDECDRAGGNACEFGCINQEPGYQCTCPTGYHLAANGFDCEGECPGSNACEYGCIDLEPGYRCTCPSGYHLAANGFDCDRECQSVLFKLFSL